MTSQDRLAAAFEDFLGRCVGMTELDEVDRLLDLELSMSQTKSIFVLSQASAPMPVSGLAKCLRLSVATAGRTVDQLVRAGFAERTDDTTDRRVKLVSITHAGREIAEQHFDAHRATLRAMCARLDDKQADRLCDAFQPLIAAVTPQNTEQENIA